MSLSDDAECVAAPGEPRMIKMTFRVFSLLVNSNRNRSGLFLTKSADTPVTEAVFTSHANTTKNQRRSTGQTLNTGA